MSDLKETGERSLAGTTGPGRALTKIIAPAHHEESYIGARRNALIARGRSGTVRDAK